MDKCLHIPEVLSNICEQMEKKSALSMALTSKRFLDPALTVIWRHLDSLKPIRCCLPPNIWRIEEEETDEGEIECTVYCLRSHSVITSADLSRYKRLYAHRIRSFHPTHKNLEMFSPEAFQSLRLATDEEPGALSPFLRSFSWFEPGALARILPEGLSPVVASPFMSLFLGPSVISVSFDLLVNPWPLHTTAMETGVKRVAQSLQELFLQRPSGKRDTSEAFLKSLSWPRLSKLEISFISPVGLRFLSSLPQLTTLNLFLQYEEIPRTARLDPGFLSLRHLSVACAEVPTLIAILQHLHPSNAIESLTYKCQKGCSTPEMSQLLDTINAHLNPRSLRSLTIVNGRNLDNPEEHLDLALDLPPPTQLAPLFGYSNLESLVFRVEGGVHARVSDLKQFSKSWPRLRTLDIRPQAGPTHVPFIDHEQLLQFLRDSPTIRTLGLPFDATRIGVDDTIAVVPSKLRTLRTFGSLIVSPSQVASFFKNMSKPHYYKRSG